MKLYPYILFDLDGTLIDTGEGVGNSVLYAMERMGLTLPKDRSTLGRFVGPPLRESYAEFCHLSPEEVQRAIRIHREYYAEKGLWECSVYPGIPELLARLRDAGRILLVATSKPEKFSVALLEKLNLARYFTFIAGADNDETGTDSPRADKVGVIRYGLEQCGITDLSGVVMVGDRKYDINGANAAGIASIGITYGYGDAEELAAAGAGWIADTPEAVGDLLLGE